MTIINANMMRNAIKGAIKNLDVNKEMVNSLNVFPVPDGDTGINMFLTIKSAGDHALSEKEDHCGHIARALSKGALMGARGNSGVILSQILRGFYIGIEDFKELDVNAIRHGFESAKDIAYKAVMKPTEGTILTVIRFMSYFASQNQRKYDDPVSFLQDILEEGKRALDKTPDMLPVLKEAGVVDSGGKGLIVLFEGAINGLIGKEISYEAEVVESAKTEVTFDENIKYGYCTEFIVHITDGTDGDVEGLKKSLLEIGDSLVCVGVDDIIKVHVHTNHPGEAFELGLKRGYLTGVKADNMRLQNAEVRRAHEEHEREKFKDYQSVDSNVSKEEKRYGFITVLAGEGIGQVYKELGVDQIVKGGQTMNPSVNDLIEKINLVNAKTIFILPNNSNIILTAEKAAELTDKNVVVIPTKTIPQGISCMLNFDFEVEEDEAKDLLIESISDVKSASITTAVRDTVVSGLTIKKGDYMGLLEKDIVSSTEDIYTTVYETIKKGVDEDTSIVTLFAGEAVKDDELDDLVEKLESDFSDITIEAIRGDQPVYYYLISIE